MLDDLALGVLVQAILDTSLRLAGDEDQLRQGFLSVVEGSAAG